MEMQNPILAQAQLKPFIEGKRIYLREVRISDVEKGYGQWLNDPEVSQFLETRFFPQSKEAIERYVASFASSTDSVFLAIVEKGSDCHIGNIKIGPINWIHRFADIALVIGDKTKWGQGFGTEAIQVMTDYAFKKLNLHRLQATIDIQNQGSTRAFIKAGFQEEGTHKKKRFSGGQYVDEKIFAILNE